MHDRSRRRFIAAAAATALAVHTRVARAQLTVQPLEPLIEKLTGGAQVRTDRVSLDIPRLADNGHSVPLRISVASAMTEREFVRTIHVLSERNPRPLVAAFHLNPHCARAEPAGRDAAVG